MPSDRFQGVIATLQTPFNKDGSIDKQLFKDNVRWLASSGAQGVYSNGSSAECFSISMEEYKYLTEVFVDEVEDKALKIVGCLSIDLRQTIVMARYAQECGADAIFTAPPFFNPLNRKERLLSMREVAKSCPRIGVIHYNEEILRYGMLAAEEYAELAEIDNFWGSKQGNLTTEEWMKLRRLTPNMPHLAGWDSLLTPAMMLGAKGVFSVAIWVSPKFTLELYEACLQENWNKALHMQQQWDQFMKEAYEPLQERGYSDPAIDKALANAFGFVPGGKTRPPLQSVTLQEEKEIKEKAKAAFAFLL